MKKVVNGADTELSVQMIEHQLRFGVYILRKEDSLLISYDPLWKKCRYEKDSWLFLFMESSANIRR